MKTVPQAICWYEGMQLLPQHFQLQGLRGEGVAAALAAAAQPLYWGVLRMVVDEAALIGGVARVLELDAILPDGLPISYVAGGEDELACEIGGEAAAAAGGRVMVHLALPPIWRGGRLDPQAGRYRSVIGEAVPDLSSGESPASLTMWQPDVRLLTESSLADMVSLPLLCVAQQGGGFVRVPFAPPSPWIAPESVLGRRISALCSKAREKCVFLGGRLRQAREAGNEDDVGEIGRLLTALWQRLPELEAALGARCSHPSQFYFALAGMAGALSALDPAAGVPAFPPFNYLDLLGCFDALLGWLSERLDRIRAGYRSCVFNRDANGFWIELPEAARNRDKLVIGLRMPSGATASAARHWLEQAIVASEPHIAMLARQRMRGLAFRALDRVEQVAYSVGDDTRLFMLLTQGEWYLQDEPLRMTQPSGVVGIEPWEALLFVPDAAEQEDAK